MFENCDGISIIHQGDPVASVSKNGFHPSTLGDP
jgi:hypothetical protein